MPPLLQPILRLLRKKVVTEEPKPIIENGGLKPPPCAQCNSACCRQTLWRYAVAIDDEDIQRSKRVSDAAVVMDNHIVIPYINGACPFLDQTKSQCGIHNERPRTCREWTCRDCLYHGPFMNVNPHVRDLLDKEDAQ